MDKPTDSDRSNGSEVKAVQIPHLTITFNPQHYSVAIGGSMPSWEFAEALLYMALKETERKIHERRAQKLVEVAAPELFPSFFGGHKT